MHQGSPKQVAKLLLDGSADIGIATDARADTPRACCWRSFPSSPTNPATPGGRSGAGVIAPRRASAVRVMF